MKRLNKLNETVAILNGVTRELLKIYKLDLRTSDMHTISRDINRIHEAIGFIKADIELLKESK